MASNAPLRRCFDDWLTQQKSDLAELLDADEPHLQTLVAKNIQHYQDYAAARRRALASSSSSAPVLYAPPWCASLESSLLWLGGCRPTLFIRLLYTLSGSHSHMGRLLSDDDVDTSNGDATVLGLTAAQLAMVNALHTRTVREEDRLSTRMAALQEDVADKPMMMPVVSRGDGAVAAAAGVMDGFEGKLRRIMEEADELRVRTVRAAATEILTPAQAVEMLAAAKQLYLSLHEWGTDRDRRSGRA